MGNKIVTEADRKRTPLPVPPNGYAVPTGGRGQRVSLERGVHTRLKKSRGKRCGKAAAAATAASGSLRGSRVRKFGAFY